MEINILIASTFLILNRVQDVPMHHDVPLEDPIRGPPRHQYRREYVFRHAGAPVDENVDSKRAHDDGFFHAHAAGSGVKHAAPNGGTDAMELCVRLHPPLRLVGKQGYAVFHVG